MPLRPFSLLVKPAGADCNIVCDYCFYHEKLALYPEARHPRMTLDTATRMMKHFFAIPMASYGFGWQGGEPTLMGRDWFGEVLALQRSLAPSHLPVTNGLQTNGTIIDASWAPMLRDHEVLVGLSLDGPAEMHDAYRHRPARVACATRRRVGAGPALAAGVPEVGAHPNPSGSTTVGTHARVEETARMLREERVPFNVLVVVGRHNEDRAEEVYDYLRSLKVRHMQFIPLVEHAPDGTPEPWSVTSEGWGRFITAIFRRWFPRDVRRVSIRHQDSLIELLATGHHNVCTTSGACGGHLVVEHTGDIYPCDFFVEPERRLGNVNDTLPGAHNPLAAAALSESYARFIRREEYPLPTACATCEYRALCNGDCPKMRGPATADGVPPAWLCSGWKHWYGETLSDMKRVAKMVAGR